MSESVLINNKYTIQDNDCLKNYRFEKLKGSYLLNELSKLSASSKEVVESLEEMDYFKQYMHVDRTIQDQLLDMIKKSSQVEGCQLILLCGSVGDGKSHLLSYLKSKSKGLLDEFEFHNDATESSDPKLDEIQTLLKVLEDFSDENINKSNKKLILAINLGVLNNFIESEEVKSNYTLLKRFIDDSKVFEQDDISENYESDKFKLVSFGDYSFYELTQYGPKSDYINNILQKVVSKEYGNIFNKAYLLDKENGLYNSMMVNYEMLSLDSVRKQVVNLLIKSLVKSKKILSTRDLLIFIYDLLVPSKFEKNKITLLDLIPNKIFISRESGEFLKIISYEDPINLRSSYLDKLLITLNTANNIEMFLETYFDKEILEQFDRVFEIYKELNRYSNDAFQIIIRFVFMMGKNEDINKDIYYDKYVQDLYFFNKGELSQYKDLFKKVKFLVYNWNGFAGDNYIYLNKYLNKFNIAEKVYIKESKKGSCSRNSKEVLERFKKNIVIAFKCNDKEETLEIDYQLYEKIEQMQEGYCCTRNDKEKLVRFVEFMQRIILHGNMDEEVIIKEKSTKNTFVLEYNDFGDEKYIFRRENI
ncbi:DNA phosphorothioation-dependent restriction protein DptF [Intestinibacter bartlettii]|uniref:DNA phosphorothioation-dependent restriction protein DptF n=1 Tax=Intestinibacter bartlettii TaxID=261299 RepID=UPI0029037AC1|nr:DNA phosphorothioation-dependent restriction protein DptF [Intestinibacter bartlettii]MDU2164144.1 DNA phosphorothioation-dependent restriction protein DptF [Intestinibacter bartlettii]